MKTIIKPTLREGAKLELASAASNAMYRVLEDNNTNYPFQTCLRCDNFDEPKEICKLFNMRPPAKVIAFGCEKFDDKEWIPF